MSEPDDTLFWNCDDLVPFPDEQTNNFTNLGSSIAGFDVTTIVSNIQEEVTTRLSDHSLYRFSEEDIQFDPCWVIEIYNAPNTDVEFTVRSSPISDILNYTDPCFAKGCITNPPLSSPRSQQSSFDFSTKLDCIEICSIATRAEGAAVGAGVGVAVGSGVGAAVGAGVGAAVGVIVGEIAASDCPEICVALGYEGTESPTERTTTNEDIEITIHNIPADRIESVETTVSDNEDGSSTEVTVKVTVKDKLEDNEPQPKED